MQKSKIIKKIRHYENQFNLPNTLLEAVVYVESNFNKDALGSQDEIGLAQLLPRGGAIQSWEKNHHGNYNYWNVDTNLKVAGWYLGERIPELLSHYGHADTISNRIKAYNSGIGNLNKGTVPFSTDLYVAKVTAYRGASTYYIGGLSLLLGLVLYY